MTFGSLFAGIGGMDLGLERAGMECKWQVEIDDYCRRVLTKHWPNVPKYGDIRELTGNELEPVDLIAGGFPCQPVSLSGERLIQKDTRWLWPEFSRILRAVRPRFALLENVTGLLVGGGMSDVLGDLAEGGYDAEWDCIPACSLGAPHRRDRVFIVAYTKCQGLPSRIFKRNGTAAVFATERGRDSFGHHIGAAWDGEPRLSVLDDGVPNGLAGSISLGNAVVPQVAEWIGRRILEAAP
jgi:DNA (cytosine-5)-methyltransferase 1